MKNWEIGPFHKLPEPILKADPTLQFHCPVQNKTEKWANNGVYNPSAAVVNGTVHMVYRADGELLGGKDYFGYNRVTCRIGHATSTDGIHFTPDSTPVLYPDNDGYQKFEWWGGCQDMHVIEDENGRYYMNYDGWSGFYEAHPYSYGTCPPEPIMDVLLSAVSDDMTHWKKLGLAIRENWVNCQNLSRSGTIVCREENGRMVAAKINGKYWMYQSHRGWLATSDDLIHWDPVFDENGKIKCLFPEYPTLRYCSKSCESGAAALLTEHGIVYFFNGFGPTPDGTTNQWSVGQALIDPADMLTVLDITDTAFLSPEYDWERNGHCPEPALVCNTVIRFNGKWILYYGGGDSSIGCAIAEDNF